MSIQLTYLISVLGSLSLSPRYEETRRPSSWASTILIELNKFCLYKLLSLSYSVIAVENVRRCDEHSLETTEVVCVSFLTLHYPHLC